MPPLNAVQEMRQLMTSTDEFSTTSSTIQYPIRPVCDVPEYPRGFLAIQTYRNEDSFPTSDVGGGDAGPGPGSRRGLGRNLHTSLHKNERYRHPFRVKCPRAKVDNDVGRNTHKQARSNVHT